MTWTDRLRGDPVPWLLEPDTPAVRAATLVRLLDRPADDPDVASARATAMTCDPIAATLAAQSAEGWWVKPGPGYSPKYTGTVWSLIFLDQLGADPADAGVQRACEYVLRMCQTTSGGLGCSGSHKESAPPPSSVLHCLNGNLLRALIGFGHLDDPRIQSAISWAADAITGAPGPDYHAAGTTGPAFACAANEGLPCAWGAVKELLALARIPAAERSPHVQAAIEVGVDFLLSCDPEKADYPMGWGNTKPSPLWFRPGFPSGYVADVLQVLEALAELGHARDERLESSYDWLLTGQDADGRWLNRYAYNRKTWADCERQGTASKWVTLRACTVLHAAG